LESKQLKNDDKTKGQKSIVSILNIQKNGMWKLLVYLDLEAYLST
jgi:hypothetical protein